MDSLTHFHSRNVHFYKHYSNSLKVTALDMFHKMLGSHPPLMIIIIKICIVPFAKGYKALLSNIIMVLEKLSQSFCFT